MCDNCSDCELQSIKETLHDVRVVFDHVLAVHLAVNDITPSEQELAYRVWNRAIAQYCEALDYTYADISELKL